MSDFNEKYRKRTKEFAVAIVGFYSQLEKRTELQVIGKQLLRSGTSVAANFRAATRARSPKEYFAKLCIVVEECDETMFWFEILKDTKLQVPDSLQTLLTESEELIKIFSVTRKNLKNNEK
jgi:four helix bundle protein